MDITLSFWLGFLTVFFLGCFFHFAYDFSHQNKFIGLFAAVNESTWEHVKIALTSSFLWTLYDFPFYGAEPNYLIAKFISLICLIIIIPVVFYFYQTFTKHTILPLDVAIFCLSIFISQLAFYGILTLPPVAPVISLISFVGILITVIPYLLFTLNPPHNFLFKDPITKKYGFEAHRNLHFHHKTKSHKK